MAVEQRFVSSEGLLTQGDAARGHIVGAPPQVPAVVQDLELTLDPKDAEYSRFREMLVRFEQATQQSQARDWPSRVFGELHRLHTQAVREDGAGLPPQMKEFVLEYVPAMLAMLGKRRIGHSETPSARGIASAASTLITEIAEMVEANMRLTRYLPEVHSISLSELARGRENVSIFGDWISVKDSGGKWHPFMLPHLDGVLHKGGLPRVLVKVLAGAPAHLIDVELPPNDIDIVIDASKAQAKEVALGLGADPNGIEEVKELRLSHLLGDRDLSMNSCFVSRDTLYFSIDAFESSKTGKIWPLLSDARTLFGSEWFVHEGTILLKNRGMMRVMKFIVEGKGEEFDFLPRNKQVDLGIYWLVLARKFFSKANAAELLGRAFELGKEMGQVRAGEHNIFDVLHRVHEQYPDFTFDSSQDELETAKWKAGKLLRRFDLAFRLAIGRRNDWGYHVEGGDTIPYSVRLTPEMRERATIFSHSTQARERFEERKSQFLEECRLRNHEQQRSPEDS